MHGIWNIPVTVMFLTSYTHRYCILLLAQRCYSLVVGTVANKIREKLLSKKDYHKAGIKLQK